MKAVRLYGPLDFRVDDIPMPEPGPGEVLVRTEYCGVCGSDIARGVDGNVPFTPNTIGHEFSASVAKLGEGVTEFKVGDLVAVMPGIACMECPHCRVGHYGQCQNWQFIGLRVKDKGAFAEYNVMPKRNLMKLPEGMDPKMGAFLEPMSVALHALGQVNFQCGKDIAIIGAGTIGQLLILCARALGAKNIYAFDMDDQKLAFARTLGADYTYNTAKEGFFEAYMGDTDGLGCEQVMEVVGLEKTILLAVDACRPVGHIALVGLLGKSVTFPPEYLRKINVNEITFTGVWQSFSLDFPGDEWRLALHYISKGIIDLEPLLYKVDRMENANAVFEEFKTPGKVQGKIILTFNEL